MTCERRSKAGRWKLRSFLRSRPGIPDLAFSYNNHGSRRARFALIRIRKRSQSAGGQSCGCRRGRLKSGRCRASYRSPVEQRCSNGGSAWSPHQSASRTTGITFRFAVASRLVRSN